MLPGGMGGLFSAMGTPEGSSRFKRMCVIMQSMTPKELDCEVPIDQPRLLRIARGSGVHPNEVVGLLQTHKQMEKMIGGMNKAGLLKGGDAALTAKLSRNPAALKAAMSKSMDPRMLSQLGGVDGFMDMMKAMGGGGGGPGGGGAGGPGGDMMSKMAGMMKRMGLG